MQKMQLIMHNKQKFVFVHSLLIHQIYFHFQNLGYNGFLLFLCTIISHYMMTI